MKPKVDYLFQAGTKAYGPHLDLVSSLHGSYAKLHGLEYTVYRGPYPASPWPGGLSSDLQPDGSILMLDLVRDKNTGWVFWVDSDAMIVGNEDPRSVMSGYLVGMAWYPKNAKHAGHLHRGSFFLRACDQVAGLLERVLREGPGPRPHWDQGLLNKYLAEPQWKGKFKTLPIEWNSAVKHNDPVECVIRAWHGMGSIQRRLQLMQAEMKRRGL